jgi:UDP-N-acetylmuramoyl-tripeptide--D-alanyl-D-alanine ligase
MAAILYFVTLIDSMTIEQLYLIYLQHPSIQTDTRKIKDGDIFFALKGPNFNGNLFAEKALELGAAYAVIDEQVGDNNERLILVEDALTTLQALAKYHRQQFTIPFIAITGSNGKTTTKELVSTVLATHYKTYTTQGNLNNHIGVPLTILSVGKDAEMAVIEMGANHQKEIESYCNYTLPNYGLITNCGKAHLEGFGGVEGVRKGKGELYDFIRNNDGLAFIFNDYHYLLDMSKGIAKSYTYSTYDGDIIGTTLQNEPYLKLVITKGLQATITTQLVGDYNLPNVLCAVAIGKYFNVPHEKIVTAIENYAPSNSRSQMIEKDGNHIILDAYNANPTSMKAAIENFAKFPSTNKVLMLGGMMELGEESIAEHVGIVTLIKQHSWLNVVLVGGDFGKIEHSFVYFNNALEAKIWFIKQAFSNAYLLIKGSRSMAMETILQ